MRAFILIIVILLASASLPLPAQTPNPYGIAGWGVLDDLGMPADCIDYDWNNLHTGSLVQMCRPNHYYEYIGIPVRWWGWNQDTGQINDPVEFDAWVTANPGKVWIISNEPDLESQDGLTREQYAQMYRTYYGFISQRDPTAKFCIGAITGGSTTDRLNYTKGWYEYVLNYYKNTYGSPMHIDIWNIHSYCGPTQIETPDQPINDFLIPFIDWCHTVDGGRYAGCEVWVTELPIGEWMGALSEEWIIWFAQRYLPRLEQIGISRWFWFVSRDSGEWATVALVKASGVSPLGQAYAALAHGYPNEVIPVGPYVPDPTPAYFSDDFSSATIEHPWMVKAGEWAIESGVMRQSRVGFQWWGECAPLQYAYGDFDMTLKMRVNASNDPINWAGVTFHTQSRFHSISNSGYLIFMRQNGAVGLHNQQDGTVREVANAVPDATQFQTIRIRMEGWRIQVWANGNLVADWTDSNQRFGAGYTTLHVARCDCSYDDVHITKLPNAPTVTDGTFTTSTDTLHADWSGELAPWGVTEHQYAIGTTPGGTDIRGWTPCPTPEITATGLSLSAGMKYYISAKHLDTDGVWSDVGTSDGITVVEATGTPGDVKSSLNGTYVGFSGIVTANADSFTRTAFVESPDRSGAIRVYLGYAPSPAVGSMVDVAGTLAEVGGERYIANSTITVTGTAPEPMEPITMLNRDVGGESLNPLTGGVTHGVGTNNIAMLVQTTGRVSQVDTGMKVFYIDDGSAIPADIGTGLAVGYSVATGSITPPSVGDYVIVTGISAIRGAGGVYYPMVKMRNQADLLVLQ